MKKRKIFLLAAVSISLTALFFPIGRDVLAHNRLLADFEQHFDALEHPSGTTPLSRRSAVGLMAACGNHTDLFVGELREYSGDKSIRSSYEKQGADLHFLDEPVSRCPTNSYYPLPIRFQSWTAWSRKELDQTKHFIVYNLSVGADLPGHDPRCH